MKPSHKRSLVWRVGIGLIVAETLVALLVGVYEYRDLKAFYFKRTEDGLRSVCSVLADSYVQSLEAHDNAGVQRLAVEGSKKSGLRVTVLSLQGEVLGDSHMNPARMDNHIGRVEIMGALANGEGSSVRFSHTLNEQAMYFAQRIGSARQPTGVLRVAASVAHINEQLESVVSTVAIGAVLWIGATIASIVFFSTRLSLAIARLGADASRLATSDHSTVLLNAPGREFEPLVESLNAMALQLRQRMDELRANQREQVAILRSMESGVVALDRKGCVLRLNLAAQRMLHMPEAVARGKTLGEIAPRSRLASHVSEAFASGPITTEEIEFNDPGRLVVRASSSVLREPDGEAVGLLIMLTDITRLRRLESMRSDFAANVSHELRTPITNIKGFAETLLNTPPDNAEEHREFLEIIARNATRLSSIVEDLLTLSQLERGESSDGLATLPTPVSRVIDTTFDIVNHRAEQSHVTLKIESEPELVAMINEHLIEQALSNLLTNAIRHSQPGSTITIRTRASTLESGAPAVEIAVEDEGPGIAKEHLPRLFERFFRVDQARGRHEGGTGLGLAIVKHIVLVHGGTVHVDSTVGEGTRFWMVLPAR
jgi:two-component system, OmpR family, phosphate regulon sensor histidine kinase PhoR